MDREIHDQPSEVTAEQGEVMVDGPNGVAVSLTPDAAAETSQRLLFGAAEARGQRIDEAQKADRRR
jgi:hypothetical protein